MSSSNVVNNLMKDNTFKNNGPIGNIKEVVDEKYDNLLNYSSSPNTDDLRNCNTQDALKGILDETLLSNTFFSTGNVQNIQNMIRFYFYKEKNVVISEQSNNELLTIMRGIYLKYSNSAANTINEIKSEVRELNKIVTEYSLKQIYINYDNYNKHINDMETLPLPMDLPKMPERNNYTYDLSSTNNM
jgi:predicted RNA-binding protein YlxR (DUF448 family)